MYKRTYINLTLQIKSIETEIKEYRKVLFELENNKISEQDYYKDKIKEFMSLKNLSRTLLTSLIDKIEIDEKKNIDIYYKFKLI